MKLLTKSIMQCAALLAAGLSVPAASNVAQAQAAPPKIVSNTALAEWDVGPNTLSLPSNTVNIAVQSAPAPDPVLNLFHFSDNPGATTANLAPNQCIGSSGAVPVTLGGAFAGISTSPASLMPATAIRAGEPLVIQVDHPAKNTDPGAIDQFEVIITTANGDRERITLIESGANSGRFRGIINTAAVPPAPVQGDCILSVRPGDSLSVELDDSNTGQTLVQPKSIF